MPQDLRGLDAVSLNFFGEGAEVLINPDLDQVTKALSKVQARSRKNCLSEQEALAVFRRVAQEGQSNAHAGVQDCPRNFKFGITSTVIQVVRLTDTMIGCSIGRREVQPGEKGLPPVSADPFENPRQWLKQIVTTFWTRLDDRQIAMIEKQTVSVAMQLAASRAWQDTHTQGTNRAAVKRRLQLDALFRSAQPVYVSELMSELRRAVADLTASGDSEVTWRAVQMRWPSISARYKRDLLGVFRQGIARRQDLADWSIGSPKYYLSFTTWSGSQTIFGGMQIVFQVCSKQLSVAEGVGHRSTFQLRKALRESAERSPHPVTTETVGWLRVHVDDLHKLVFIDEVQSDVMEALLKNAAEGDAAAQMFAKDLADWQVNGFSSVRHWAAAIGYRVAIHSEMSLTAVGDRTNSARKRNVYYAALIKRFRFALQMIDGYPAAIFAEDLASLGATE
jgi:hypothetical protein